MIKKLKIFLESTEKVEDKKKEKAPIFTKITDDEAREWLRNVKPIKFSEVELEKIKELLDFRIVDGVLDYPFSSVVLETGVIYSLNRDFYLICLGSLNKTSNYWCKGLPNLVSFIKQKLVTK